MTGWFLVRIIDAEADQYGFVAGSLLISVLNSGASELVTRRLSSGVAPGLRIHGEMNLAGNCS